MSYITYNCLFFNTIYTNEIASLRKTAITFLQSFEEELYTKLYCNITSFKEKWKCFEWIEMIYSKKMNMSSLLAAYMYKSILELEPNYQAIVKNPILFEDILVYIIIISFSSHFFVFISLLLIY